jgi:hypothetical protein
MKIIRPVVVDEGMLLASTIPETDYPDWASGTTYTYAVDNPPRVMYRVGTHHHVYECKATTTGDVPPDAPSKWSLVSAINRWRMFDGASANRTTAYRTIDVTVNPGKPIDSVALIGVNATTYQIVFTDSNGASVYNSGTVNLFDPAGINDWFAFFFEPVTTKQDVALASLPQYVGGVVRLMGGSRDLGGTQYGAKVGIQDYSVKQTNAWGDITISERAYAKRAEFTLLFTADKTDSVQAILSAYRTTPVVYLGAEQYASTVVYGFYKDFSVDIAYPSYSVCTLSVEGLTQ